MTDWSKDPKVKWRCAACVIPLVYSQIWHHSTGAVLCYDCFIDWTGVIGQPQPEPRLCDECGRGLVPLETVAIQEWMGRGISLRLCTACLAEVDPISVDDAIQSLSRVIQDSPSQD